jgi:hypothetical protein
VENTVFRRQEIREVFKNFVVVEMHLDGQDRISKEVRDKNAGRAMDLAKTTAMPTYVVVNSRDGTMMSNWGWEKADPKAWKKLLDGAVDRWRNLKK